MKETYGAACCQGGLTLWIVGFLLYIVFVIPRWWVLTGDVPATAATFGRIVTGFPSPRRLFRSG